MLTGRDQPGTGLYQLPGDGLEPDTLFPQGRGEGRFERSEPRRFLMNLPSSRRSEAQTEMWNGDRVSDNRDKPGDYYLRAICLLLMDVDDKLSALLERGGSS
jgi:hypothetical protein